MRVLHRTDVFAVMDSEDQHEGSTQDGRLCCQGHQARNVNLLFLDGYLGKKWRSFKGHSKHLVRTS